MIAIRADLGALSTVARRLDDALGSGKIIAAAQLALTKTVQAFYASKPSESRFWEQFTPTATDGFKQAMEKRKAALVLEGYAARILTHKVNGGPIVPYKAKMLAIPLIPQARKAGSPGRVSTPEFFVLADKAKNKAFLARKWKGKGASKKPLQLWWLLVRSVMQKPHPDAIPSAEQIRAGVMPAVLGAIREAFR